MVDLDLVLGEEVPDEVDEVLGDLLDFRDFLRCFSPRLDLDLDLDRDLDLLLDELRWRRLLETFSSVLKMVPQLPPERRNSVIAARMRTSDSARTSLKAASKLARLATSMTWAFFMLTRDAMFNPVMFRRTFESPITEKSPDMIGVCVCRTPPEIGCSENFLICVVPE